MVLENDKNSQGQTKQFNMQTTGRSRKFSINLAVVLRSYLTIPTQRLIGFAHFSKSVFKKHRGQFVVFNNFIQKIPFLEGTLLQFRIPSA